MHTWQLQQAKSHFSEVVNLVLTEGAQMVTRRGKSEVVILAASEYQKLTKTVSLNQILKHAPRGNELDITRSQEGVRKIELSYLLDTCFLSEFVKQEPSKLVLGWMEQQNEQNLYISSITWGELQRGVAKLPFSHRKSDLTVWLNQMKESFSSRILPISVDVSEQWGLMTADLESRGLAMPLMDSLIAATARHYQMTLVTRNVNDFKDTQLQLINPWQEYK